MPSLYAAFCLYISTSALSLACSSSQRRRSSSKRANRSRRASWYDAKPPGWVHTRLPRGAELDGDDPGGGVGEQLPVVGDEQDRLVRLADPLLEPDLAGHVEEVVGLVEQQHLVGAAQQVLQHQPLLLAAGEGATARGTSPGRRAAPSAAIVQTSQVTSRS